ncbi:hypothetical protein QTP70_025894 [Hemibagrus guttatus]|uniref:Uncharacterized protein n=1 Tax=Hemibagrus guttatus TaxID=175788 RepID=A0AAE0QTI7_9TELE|nr:hypothetical protein QTP70_025894 [Hemibagrus guttatus]
MAQLLLLASICLFGTGIVLAQEGCVFTELNQDLDRKSWDAGANISAHLTDISDERECQNVCCTRQDCQLAMIITPADGSPQCFLVNCMKDGKNVCVFEPSNHSKAYFKTRVSDRSNSSTDQCLLEKVVGHCRAAFPRFYYDVADQTCKTFVYGGCGGNNNNFKTKEECENACNGVTGWGRAWKPVKIKVQNLSVMVVEEAVMVVEQAVMVVEEAVMVCMIVFFLDTDEEGMLHFNFLDVGAPADLKIVNFKDSKDFDNAKYQAACLVPADSGPCRAAFFMYYFEPNTQSCQSFIYGGCKGNKNRYSTLEECMSNCAGKDAKPTEAPLPEMTTAEYAEKCQAEPQVGMCRASIPRYYYSNGMCKRFTYGGCGGNSNNYHTEEECMKTCTVKIIDSKDSKGFDNAEYQAACLVPADSGPCRAAFFMYYFEPNTQSCQSFIYGGCRGNKNRYSTLEECMSNCAGKDGGFEEHGHHRARWTPAFFLVAALAIMSVVLLVGLLLISVHRVKSQRLLLLDDKQELLPEEHLPEEEAQSE